MATTPKPSQSEVMRQRVAGGPHADHEHVLVVVGESVLMPKMGGVELAERLSKARPELKVLYTSGYNDSGGNLTSVGGSADLQKPYAMEELARTLRDLLDSGDSAESALPAGRR